MAAPTPLGVARRRELGRVRRHCAAVGVEVSVARLREIAAGDPPTDAELVDLGFAEAAHGIRRDQRRARRRRARRRCVHSTIVFGATVLSLTALLCLGLAFFAMASHSSPF